MVGQQAPGTRETRGEGADLGEGLAAAHKQEAAAHVDNGSSGSAEVAGTRAVLGVDELAGCGVHLVARRETGALEVVGHTGELAGQEGPFLVRCPPTEPLPSAGISPFLR